MKRVSPKYIPREWMLAEAYDAVNYGDNTIFFELQSLFRSPYDEHLSLEDKYYRKCPLRMIEDLGVGGLSHMT
jgi:uncharacterized protein YdiU (UPF0061 family)